MKWIFGVLALFSLSACSVFGVSNVEMPEYQVVNQQGKFEVRQYGEMIVAETKVSGFDFKEGNNEAFRRIAGYIFGKNKKKMEISMTAPVTVETGQSEKIAMTAPVLTEGDKKSRVMAFVLPSEYTLETLPEPLDKRVVIRKVKAKKVAVIRFSGRFTEESFEKHKKKLQLWVGEQGLQTVSGYVYAGYNPPWTLPFMKRNEVHVRLR